MYAVGRGVRETGQALDRVGQRLQGRLAYTEQCTFVASAAAAAAARSLARLRACVGCVLQREREKKRKKNLLLKARASSEPPPTTGAAL